MHEYTSSTDEPTHLYINGMSFDEPVTETPKVGTSEVWYVINLTEDNHPLHIHLALFRTLEQVKLVDFDTFKDCMIKYDDAIKCDIDRHARGMKKCVPAHEKGWKNVFKMKPGYVTKIFVRFSYIHVNGSYPFDATAEPGYVYHCHDRTSRIVIGVGEQCDGLYYLRDFQDGHARANGFTSHDSIELWH
ncbi:hypothetical protein KSS87_014180 [Heliosperma pusillum]|nr:hypothetical protein KSS87_014180 [Heliosperma pusillum]